MLKDSVGGEPLKWQVAQRLATDRSTAFFSNSGQPIIQHHTH
jgi:hypothetical protein